MEKANDEYAISWMRFSATMKTNCMGMKTGEKFGKSDIELIKINNGKAIEH